MKRVLTIASEEDLAKGLEEATSIADLEFERASGWQEAQSQLVGQTYQAVLIDYESVEAEGLNSFVQLDDMLQKENTGAIVLLREEAPRAEEFVETLESFETTVHLTTDAVDAFDGALEQLLDRHPDPAESQPTGRGAQRTVEVVLPDVTEGKLSDHSVARVVHTLRRQEWSGVLTLSTESMERTIEFSEGCLVDDAEGDEEADFSQLKAAFAWSNGRFEFERDDSIEGDRVEPYPVLLKGAQDHLDQRSAMDELTPVMDKYVSATNFLEACRDQVDGDDALEAFVEQVDGDRTLEEVLSAIASRVLTGFQAGFIAVECDFVALTDEATGTTVEVDFSSVETSAEKETSGGREGVSPTAAGSGGHDEPETAEREAELRRTHERLADASPYEVFDLWEGCGEEAVRNRYFKLVKRHHPDSYGGNISDEGKQLAERIFIRIKDSYSELLKHEDEQEVTREEAMQSDTTGDTSLEESLTSPSVTAMGGETESDREAQVSMGNETSEPSIETGSPTTEEMAAPAASKRPSTDRVESDENPAHARRTGPNERRAGPETPQHGGRPRTTDESEGKSTRENRATAEQRTEKIDKLRDRIAKKTPYGSEDRKEKLNSLNENTTTERKRRVDNFDPPESREDAQEYFNLGYRAFKREDEAQAFKYFELAHEFDDPDPLWTTFYAYTLFLRDADQRDTARELLEEVVASDDKQAKPDAHLFLGRILKVREEHEAAKEHFRKALELDPNSLEAKRELRVYEMRGDSDDSSDSDSGGFLGGLFD